MCDGKIHRRILHCYPVEFTVCRQVIELQPNIINSTLFILSSRYVALMKTSNLFFFAITLTCLLPVSTLLADNFISESSALQCIKTNKTINVTQQNILASEANKANLKSKIDYLIGQIQKRRDLIEGLDQQPSQINNDSYNQLIDQFEELREERKNIIKIYNAADKQHLQQHEKYLDLQKTYSQQCLNNIQINKALFKKVCGLENSGWCGLFSF